MKYQLYLGDSAAVGDPPAYETNNRRDALSWARRNLGVKRLVIDGGGFSVWLHESHKEGCASIELLMTDD